MDVNSVFYRFSCLQEPGRSEEDSAGTGDTAQQPIAHLTATWSTLRQVCQGMSLDDCEYPSGCVCVCFVFIQCCLTPVSSSFLSPSSFTLSLLVCPLFVVVFLSLSVSLSFLCPPPTPHTNLLSVLSVFVSLSFLISVFLSFHLSSATPPPHQFIVCPLCLFSVWLSFLISVFLSFHLSSAPPPPPHQFIVCPLCLFLSGSLFLSLSFCLSIFPLPPPPPPPPADCLSSVVVYLSLSCSCLSPTPTPTLTPPTSLFASC